MSTACDCRGIEMPCGFDEIQETISASSSSSPATAKENQTRSCKTSQAHEAVIGRRSFVAELF